MRNPRQERCQTPGTLKGASICMGCDREHSSGRMGGGVSLASGTMAGEGL